VVDRCVQVFGGRGYMREYAVERLYRELGAAGFEAILDDRDERPGVKFKDADLLGIPIRVTVGALLGREGKVEVRSRRDRQDVAVAPDGVVAAVALTPAMALSAAIAGVPDAVGPMALAAVAEYLDVLARAGAITFKR